MAVLKDMMCSACDAVQCDVWHEYGTNLFCRCGGTMKMIPAITHHEWGGPRHLPHLREESFRSKCEMNQWAKDNNAAPAASRDKHHGARNESHLNLGKLYSGRGMGSRRSHGSGYGD